MATMFGGVFSCVLSLVFLALVIYPMWRIFEKVGYPGVASLIMLVPIVNLIALWYAALNPLPFEQRMRGGMVPPPPPPMQQ
jgi:hypothetical protein